MNDKQEMGNDSMADDAVPIVSGHVEFDSEDRPSRAQARLAREQAARIEKSALGLKTLLRRWWVFPLLIAVSICIYLGIQSANTPVPSQTTVVVNVPSD